MDEPNHSPIQRRISEDLKDLLHAAGGQPMQIREILHHTQGRGLQTIAVILCLPFLSPVSLPFLSIPFGAAIAICGLRIAFRHRPWLPAFIMNRGLPFAVIEKMVKFGVLIYTRLESLLKPRWLFFTTSHAAIMAAGLMIALGGFFLSLPIPPPFPLTNTIPGFAVIFICLGMLERDGLLIFLGYMLTLVAAIYVSFIAAIGRASLEHIWKWIS